MVVLPTILGSHILRLTVQVRFGYEILRLPGNKPVFFALAAMIYELSWLEKQGAILVRKVLFSGILLVFLFTAQVVFAGSLKVFVSIVPQKYFVEKIGGDLVEINVMVQPGASPATYEPKPRQMVALAKTDV